MGNYMSAKGFVVTGIIFAGFIGFIVGVPSYQMVYYTAAGSQPAVWSYFGACDSINQYAQNCHGLTLDFIHCQLGETPGQSAYHYDPMFTGALSPWIDRNPAGNLLDEPSCRSMIAAEAFGIMAIIFSFFGVIGALIHEKGRIGGGAASVLASVCGIIALIVFFANKPENLNNIQGTAIAAPQNKAVSDYVSNGTLSLGYSTGLQLVGIIASFFGGFLAFTGDFGPTGGASSSAPASSRQPVTTHHYPQSSAVPAGAGVGGETEMH